MRGRFCSYIWLLPGFGLRSWFLLVANAARTVYLQLRFPLYSYAVYGSFTRFALYITRFVAWFCLPFSSIRWLPGLPLLRLGCCYGYPNFVPDCYITPAFSSTITGIRSVAALRSCRPLCQPRTAVWFAERSWLTAAGAVVPQLRLLDVAT